MESNVNTTTMKVTEIRAAVAATFRAAYMAAGIEVGDIIEVIPGKEYAAPVVAADGTEAYAKAEVSVPRWTDSTDKNGKTLLAYDPYARRAEYEEEKALKLNESAAKKAATAAAKAAEKAAKVPAKKGRKPKAAATPEAPALDFDAADILD